MPIGNVVTGTGTAVAQGATRGIRRFVPNADIYGSFYGTMNPQYANMWEIEIVPLTNEKLIDKVKRQAEDSINPTKPSINKYQVISTDLPFIGFETEQRGTGSSHITGINFPETFQITFSETNSMLQGLNVVSYFENWMDQVYDKTRRIFRTGNNTRVAVLKLQRQVFGAYVPSAKYKFIGILPISIDSVSLNYDSGEPLEISVTFKCDDIIRDTGFGF